MLSSSTAYCSNKNHVAIIARIPSSHLCAPSKSTTATPPCSLYVLCGLYNHGLALACAHHRISAQELVHRTVPGFAGRSFAVADRAVDHRDSVVPSLGDPCGLAPVHP